MSATFSSTATQCSSARQNLIGFLSIALAAFIVQILAFAPVFNLYDDGIIAFGAMRVLGGEIPYRDFWSMYGPGQFYAVAGLFAAFGTDDLTVRLYGITLKALSTATCFSLVRLNTGPLVAMGAAAIGFLVLFGMQLDGFPVFPALLLLMLAILSLPRSSNPAAPRLLLTGAIIGLAALFRHDLGFYFCLALAAMVSHQQFVSRANKTEALWHTGRICSGYALGVLVVLLPVFLLLLRAAGAEDLWFNLVLAPATIYADHRALPWPGSDLLAISRHHYSVLAEYAVYLPFLALPILLLTHIRLRRQRTYTAQPERSSLLVLLAVCSLLFTLKGSVRVSAVHMLPAILLSVICLASLWPQLRPGLIRAPASLALLLVSAVLAGAACLPGIQLVKNNLSQNLDHWLSTPVQLPCQDSQLPRGHCVAVDADYQRASDYILAHTQPGDPIYVGSGRHDKVFVNAVGLYFLLDRSSATYWHELHPGIQTQARVQQEMIDSFTRQPPRLAILDERWDSMQEPNASAQSSGNHALDVFFREHYTESARFGPIRVLQPIAAAFE
ncbi:hypothetical protein [Halopseudomonas salegens]|uniref:4-amino-4-deoxy-L-arabinose transferase-like glycosyltransferase n=1 Tax=Halopseudomonas salegens TaxID=1434072 RepID=A0A1H2HZZ8_9GAMM|nr:hypothetical protein [Halopseudomonas salegens]SDU37349.1 hypothetical protein SAMN05216210_3441 [Halopseudomonas salegens]